MKEKGRKIILFLVEGISDKTALEFIDKINKNEKIKFFITNGDITSRIDVEAGNCISTIDIYLKNFIEKNKFKKTDIIEINHILDIDGVYISENNIQEDSTKDKFIYTENGIFAPSKEKVITRNMNKRKILEKLLKTSQISLINYKIYYMSCNLEHVLHNRLEDISDNEKKELSNEFANRFYEKELEFIEFINNPEFKVLGDYKETWKFIKKDLNSLKRYSNFWLFFENIEKD